MWTVIEPKIIAKIKPDENLKNLKANRALKVLSNTSSELELVA